jgi:RNA-binding protein 5/10
MEGFSGYGASYGGPILTGETDEDLRQNPSQFIVIRDLEPSVTEELLAKGVMKLFREEAPQPARDPSKPANKLKSTAPTNSSVGLGATRGSLRRVFLIRDKRTDESWKYGFAEFATIDDAKGAIAKFNASPRFTIASKPVIVAFIHTGVFVPVLEPVTEQTANFSFAPIYNPSLRVKYWDDRAYPSSHVVSAGPELDSADADAGAASDNKAGSASEDAAAKRKKDRDALAAKIAAKKALVMGPQMQMWAKKAAEIHGAPAKRPDEDTSEFAPGSKPASDASVTRAQKSTDPVAASWRDQYVSYADWDTVECLLCGKFSNEEWLIYHETHMHNHYKDEETKSKAATLLASRSKEPRTVVRRTPRRQCDDLQPYISYADHDSLTCYVCMRKLPNIKVLRRHEQESELHRRNLSDAAKIDKAKARLADLGLKPTRMLPLGYDGPVRQGPQYRDRAKERRQVYNQPKKPAPPRPDNGNKRKPVEEAAPAESEPAAKKSKGAGLLAKMGWTAGVGLGASGDGRTEAVGAEVYVPGVGLGAEGGKLGDASEEAARKMVPGDFVEKTREKARERFERLQ